MSHKTPLVGRQGLGSSFPKAECPPSGGAPLQKPMPPGLADYAPTMASLTQLPPGWKVEVGVAGLGSP